MVIFVGWTRLKLREVKPSIPVHHIRDSIPHQLSLAPRTVLTPHSYEDSPIDNFSFPLFPSLFLTPPHTLRNGEGKSINQKEKALGSPCILQCALQPAPTGSCCHIPFVLPCLAIQRTATKLLPWPATALSSCTLCILFYQTEPAPGPPRLAPPSSVVWASHQAPPCTDLLTPPLLQVCFPSDSSYFTPFEAESSYIAQAGSNLVCNSGAPYPHLPSMLAW